MGWIELLTGHTQVLNYEILIDDHAACRVSVLPKASTIPDPEYIRLWACYFTKIIYNFGGPSTDEGAMILGHLYRIAYNHSISSDTNFFQVSQVIGILTNDIQIPNRRYYGEYYAKSSTKRTVKTYFPWQINPNEVATSCFALMQVALLKNRHDPFALRVFQSTMSNMMCEFTLKVRHNSWSIQDVVILPNKAYVEALTLESEGK